MIDTLVKLFNPNDGPHFVVMCGITLTLILSVSIIVERVFRYWYQYDLANSSAFMSTLRILPSLASHTA